MKTQYKKTGDTMVVSMAGRLSYESTEPLREDLDKIAKNVKKDEAPKKIIFNMEELEFVGSSGISSFIQTLKDFGSENPVKPRFCNVRSEFQRVMKALDDSGQFEFYEDEENAKKSFDQ